MRSEVFLQCSPWAALPGPKSLDHSMTHLLQRVLKGFPTGRVTMMSQVPPRIGGTLLLRAVSLLSQVLCVPRSDLAVLERDGVPWPGINSAFQAGQRGPAAAAFGSACFYLPLGSILVRCRRN